MQIRLGEVFNTVRTEGSILPPDLLRRIVTADKSIEGLTPADYELNAAETIGEAVNRAWNRLVGTWWNFRSALQKLHDADTATSLTREQWLLPLFEDLGFGRLTPTKAIEVEGRTYAVSHISSNTPIHLVGFHIDLDRRSPGVAGASRSSPHSLVQELLNRSPGYLWAIVSNGRYLRILRDNISLTRQAYVEFDLEAMMAGEVYSDFVLLWLLAHRSRFAAQRPEECRLEQWSQAANAQGTRALDQLRSGVENAILALGRGFISHRHNDQLLEDLASGRLSPQGYYRQLLRVVYRLIFLFVAEDRELLLDQQADEASRNRYLRYFSLTRLRRLAAGGGGSKYVDLYRGLALVSEQLGTDGGCPGLALLGLGSFLWSPDATSVLDVCDLTNRDLLEAVRALAFTSTGTVRRTVDYRNLGSEELGSVYESLLELHPKVDVKAPSFELITAGGNERKTTGSYYTPTTLISSLLDSALNPILNRAISGTNPERSLLDLKILDPACGSGHFLIASAHRLAKKLAAIRTGDDEPSPAATRSALRDVIGRCIFGVDTNEMAVELCKVSLWMEALDPGRPLSFLDHHIVRGNSLLGATPALLAQGVPDGAFEAIEDDDKTVVAALRKRNRRELAGQTILGMRIEIAELQDQLSKGLYAIDALDDKSALVVREKAVRYRGLVASAEVKQAKLVANAWCAAFVVPKKKDSSLSLTQGLFKQIATNPGALGETTQREIDHAAATYQYLHWHLTFPDVFHVPTHGEPTNPESGWSGGFDVVLSNPPWDKVKLQEKEWFAVSQPEIAAAPSAALRRKMIAALETKDPGQYRNFVEAARQSEGQSHFIRNSGRYPLTGRGDVNTYAVFAEVMRSVLAPAGRLGAVLPTGIATDDTTKHFFAQLVEERSLVSLYDFENKLGLFPAVDSRMKFCLLTLMAPPAHADKGADFVFFAHAVADLQDEDRRITLSTQDFALLNPNTLTCPVFRTKRDAEIAKSVYLRVPVLVTKGPPRFSPWGASFITMFHMTNDSHLFRSSDDLSAEGWTVDGNVFYRDGESYLPLYEAKMIAPYDHRAAHVVISPTAVIRQGQPSALTLMEHESATSLPIPRYWVPDAEVEARLGERSQEWLACLADVTSPTNERTVIAVLIPRVGVGNNAPVLITSQEHSDATPLLVANLSSFVLDFLARSKVGGIHLNFFIVEQFPVLPPIVYEGKAAWSPAESLRDWMISRIVELTYTASDLAALASDLGYRVPPFRWNEQRRPLLMAELDAAFFHLYGIRRDDVEYMMDSFAIVRRRDQAAYGEFRTKLLILDRYDDMDRAIHSGQTYKTALDPPPAAH
jgi:N-6 DNA Methylase